MNFEFPESLLADAVCISGDLSMRLAEAVGSFGGLKVRLAEAV